MFDDPEGNHWLTPGVSLWMPSSLDGSSRRWRLTRAWSLTTPPSSNCRRLLLTCPRLKGPRAWKAPLGTFRHEHGSFKHSQVDGPRIYLFYILYIIHMCTLTTTHIHTHTDIYIYIYIYNMQIHIQITQHHTLSLFWRVAGYEYQPA